MLSRTPQSEITRPKVLIVDDDPTNLFVLSEFLGSQEFHILRASSGFDAVTIAEAERPEVVLMDLSMPGMDGFEAAELIFENSVDEKARPIIIAVSANVTRAHRDRCSEAGFTDFFGKPVDFDNIVEMLTNHLERR